MHNLVRRPSGYYALRLAVPKDLRAYLNKTEIIESTGTRELALAKIIAGTAGARWRERFLELRRLKTVASIDAMTPEDILRLTSGSPALHGATYLPLDLAARASGIAEEHLLLLASEGTLGLWCRVGRVQGVLIPEASLEVVEPSMGRSGGLVIPPRGQLPAGAVDHVADGALRIDQSDVRPLVSALLAGAESAELVAFATGPEGTQQPWVFVPSEPVTVGRKMLEVSAAQVEGVRRKLAKLVAPEQVEHARGLEKAALAPGETKKFHSDKLLSEALSHYVEHRLRKNLQNEGEIKRIRQGCSLLIEFEGDVAIGSVTTEQLRSFRDSKLAKVPASENKVRLIHGTKSVSKSVAAVEGSGWPVMSAAERDKRMRWIGSWFKWLKEQRWLAEDPAHPLQGESVLSVRERKKAELHHRADEVRAIFTPEDLGALFSEDWFKTGQGRLTKAGTYREFMPHYYWAPLIALLAGGARVNEVAQLRLDDFGVTAAGTGFVAFQAVAEDQRLKNKQSRREVPLHPLLIELGIMQWVQALAGAGYDRLFPELKHDSEKGYGKALSKWFTRFMASRGYPRDGTLTFHSFRHTFVNALPPDVPERVRRQFTGHQRGSDAHDAVYRKDLEADEALPFITRLNIRLPAIAPFDIDAGLKAVTDALARKADGKPNDASDNRRPGD